MKSFLQDDESNGDEDSEDECFILTTDADVQFRASDVEALLDLMTRDHSVGAVCARTHPMGGGPLVWYQKFEYAIGHWFQKVHTQYTILPCYLALGSKVHTQNTILRIEIRRLSL